VKYTFLVVGRLSREYQAVFDHYAALLRAYAKIEVLEVAEVALREGRGRVLAREGDALLKRLRPGAFTVVLDREGRELSSEELSGFLARQKLHGKSEFLFILGGALGLDEQVREAADLRWSLGRLTFPHQLARCMVAEQLYRALRIERGEPYHY
jgi:23S rRNA (pseudouridine1915-N3)-methyltransferase